MKVVIWIVTALVVALGIGLFAFRATAPTEELEPTAPAEFIDTTETEPGQFLQDVTTDESGTEEVDEESSPVGADGPSVSVDAGEPSTVGEELRISMDETGFTPETVTVSPGTTVIFVNNGQGPHRPASAVHPTHEVLPGFDSKRGLTTGESYSFTFTQAGNWKFHDHLNPQFTGSVVVE